MAANKASAKDKKPAKPAPVKEKAKPAKAAKPKADAGAEAIVEAAPAKVEVPRAPVDPRTRVMKKFEGRFLPKGPLRDRLKAIEVRWNSGEDHGGVTLEELKSLLADWRASREKARPAAAR